MVNPQNRTQRGYEYINAIAAVDAKLEAFIKEHPNFADKKVKDFIEQCEKEKLTIDNKYSDISNAKPIPSSYAEKNTTNIGEY